MDSSADCEHELKIFGKEVMKIVGQLMATDGATLRDAYFRAVLKTGNQCVLT